MYFFLSITLFKHKCLNVKINVELEFSVQKPQLLLLLPIIANSGK